MTIGIGIEGDIIRVKVGNSIRRIVKQMVWLLLFAKQHQAVRCPCSIHFPHCTVVECHSSLLTSTLTARRNYAPHHPPVTRHPRALHPAHAPRVASPPRTSRATRRLARVAGRVGAVGQELQEWSQDRMEELAALHAAQQLEAQTSQGSVVGGRWRSWG